MDLLKKALSLTNGCVQIFSQGKLEELFALDDSFCDRAAECGVRSFQIMAGVLDQESISFSSELLSYEGPFGVGYAVAAFEVLKPIHDANCTETETECHQRGEDAEAQTKRDLDPYVALAHASIESFVKTNTSLVRPENLSEEMINTKAGVFVSIHEAGELRGCIGTIAPMTDCVADEIIRNGIAASTQDLRFPPVEIEELSDLEISVDVLATPEPMDSIEELDPTRFGVIVTKGALLCATSLRRICGFGFLWTHNKSCFGSY